MKYMKYEGPKSHQSKDMANVKSGQTNGQMHTHKLSNRRAKTICPQSINAGSKKYFYAWQ